MYKTKTNIKVKTHNDKDVFYLLTYSFGHLSSLLELAMWFACIKIKKEKKKD